MHSITRQRDEFSVVRCDNVLNGTVLIVLFHKLSFHTAIDVCNSLNGGKELSDTILRILPMCMPSE